MNFTVENGSFSYNRRKVLDNVFLELKDGELLSVLGPNGAGKTTLMRCMLGFLKWESGHSKLDGKIITDYKIRDLWEKISYVPQSRNVETSSLSGLEFVLLGRGSHIDWYALPGQEDKDSASEVMEKLGIYQMRDRKMDEISGGELQLFLIARALVSNPQMIVLDEPESNLDFKNQLIVLDVLSDLADGGMGVIFNTHYPSHALQRAGRSLIVKHGGTSIFGDTQKIVNEANLAEAFGVKTVIGDIETENRIYQEVMPIKLINENKNTKQTIEEEKKEGDKTMDTRLAIISIIIEESGNTAAVNEELHKRAQYIIGRMGMPYPKRHVQIITIVIDGPQDEISSLSGRLGQIPNVSIKTTYSKV